MATPIQDSERDTQKAQGGKFQPAARHGSPSGPDHKDQGNWICVKPNRVKCASA